jgi:glycine/D-amino acid oxidase-like deaminating enzyme
MKKNSNTIICGAGIAGIATAFVLVNDYGLENITLIDERPPLTLTSAKSSECYRNWWPGPGTEMVELMNRSIERLEEIAIECGNRFHMNQQGYLYVTSTEDGINLLKAFAIEASELGAGEIRLHKENLDGYQKKVPFSDDSGFVNKGADLILGIELIQKLFPYLSNNVKAVLHVRKAGWLSAQQLGMHLLDVAKKKGVSIINDRVSAVKENRNHISGVVLASGISLECDIFVNASGPMLAEVGEMLGETIPVSNSIHLKSIIEDSDEIVSRDAPLIINADAQKIVWSKNDIDLLNSDEETNWLTETLPSGAHFRPEGGDDAKSLLILWDAKDQPSEANFPVAINQFVSEIALRGLTPIVPKLGQYLERMNKPIIDGGYYTHTEENRPIASPTNVNGSYVIGALSGYGIMASMGVAELVAAYITGSELPKYAPAFRLDRYQNKQYREKLSNWGESWQL